MKLLSFISLIFAIKSVSSRIYNIENSDGSYTIGLNSNSRNDATSALIALLTKSAGYTLDNNFEENSTTETSFSKNSPEEPQSRGLLTPHLEILQLIEAFLQFKGELGARLRDLISDNSEMIRSVYNTVVSKIGTLHSFTLIGIRILRKMLEIASSFMAQWQVNVPGLSLDLSLGNNVGGNGGSSFSVNKNSNYFGKK